MKLRHAVSITGHPKAMLRRGCAHRRPLTRQYRGLGYLIELFEGGFSNQADPTP